MATGGGARAIRSHGSWGSAVALFGYALAFSHAYVTLSTGTGALILFGAVQVTMIGAAVLAGDRPGVRQLAGGSAAIAGLVYLVVPGLTAPDPAGALLMAVAGVAWGVYSLRGRGSAAPVRMTGGNFLRAAPFALLLLALPASAAATPGGIALALISGSLTSGLGYVAWYRTLRSLTTTHAALVQLLVPVLAAFAGVVVLGESVTARLLVASALVLGGVALAVAAGRRPRVA